MSRMFAVFLMASKSGRYEVRTLTLANQVPQEVLRKAKVAAVTDLSGPEAAAACEALNLWYNTQLAGRGRK